MSFLFLAVGLLKIFGRLMPVESFCSMAQVRSDVVVVLLTLATLASGLVVHQLLIACAALFPLGFALTVVSVRRYYRSDSEVAREFPLLSTLASRAPPLS